MELNIWKYLTLSVMILVFALPISATMFDLLLCILIKGEGTSGHIAISIGCTVFSGVLLALLWGRFTRLPSDFLTRYAPVAVLLAYTLAVWLGLLIAADGKFDSDVFLHGRGLLLPFSLLVAPFDNDVCEPSPLRVWIPLIPFLGYFSFALTMSWWRKTLTNGRGASLSLLVIGGLTVGVAATLAWQSYDTGLSLFGYGKMAN